VKSGLIWYTLLSPGGIIRGKTTTDPNYALMVEKYECSEEI